LRQQLATLVGAAVLVQIGNSIFWVAYAPLIFSVAGEGEREHWFALGTSLRTAGWAAGGGDRGRHGGRRGTGRLPRRRRGERRGVRPGGLPIFCPAVVTLAPHAGAGALWLPLAAVALLDLGAVALLARRMTALTQPVGQAPPQSALLAELPLEADGI
jgi:hypothetical protein